MYLYNFCSCFILHLLLSFVGNICLVLSLSSDVIYIYLPWTRYCYWIPTTFFFHSFNIYLIIVKLLLSTLLLFMFKYRNTSIAVRKRTLWNERINTIDVGVSSGINVYIYIYIWNLFCALDLMTMIRHRKRDC